MTFRKTRLFARTIFSGLMGLLLMLLLGGRGVLAADKSGGANRTCLRQEGETGTGKPQTLHFCVYGDTRDGHAMHRKVLALMLKQQPEFILQTGDLVHDGSSRHLWEIYDGITGTARKQVPFYPARGNHDLGGPGYAARVTAPFTSGNKLYYSFDKANCHFICLAVDEVTAYALNSAQYKWLRQDLETTRQTHPAHIFVFFHVPPYSIGAHGSDLEVRRQLCPLFTRYGVDVVFNGHDHNYYRTKRDGVTYIVTGGGGAPLYPVTPSKGAIQGDKYESVNNGVVCDVKGASVTLTALRADGTTLDHFTSQGK